MESRREVNLIKKLSEFPKNNSIFIDANIFHLYLRGPKKIQEICTNFLEKIERKEITGYTSPLVLDELAYKLLLKKIEEKFQENPINILRKNPKVISNFSNYVELGLDTILGIENLKIIDISKEHVENMVDYMKKYLLLPRDALHLSVMLAINCKNIASTDDDFDRAPMITRWTPRINDNKITK